MSNSKQDFHLEISFETSTIPRQTIADILKKYITEKLVSMQVIYKIMQSKIKQSLQQYNKIKTTAVFAKPED